MWLGIYWAVVNGAAVTMVMQFRSDPLAYSIAYFVHILFGNLAAVFAAKKLLPDAHLWPRMRAASVSAIVGRMLLLPWSRRPVTLTVAIIAVTAAFAGMVALLDKTAFVDLRTIVQGDGKAEKTAARWSPTA